MKINQITNHPVGTFSIFKKQSGSSLKETLFYNHIELCPFTG